MLFFDQLQTLLGGRNVFLIQLNVVCLEPFLRQPIAVSRQFTLGGTDFFLHVANRIDQPLSRTLGHIQTADLVGDLDIAFCVFICPRSIRFVMATSPSRVNNGTTPISRRYSRTGSLVFSSAPAESSSSRSSSLSSSSVAIAAACSIKRSSESAT